ncbi:hypothetical protein HPP92_017074 [Vanilla planifolia]|uniref:Uncharacterized protein n=1 Tax=Vanilla planifolia TaxID=51239 RepID=A0A835QDD8_VANPL|nr:hypothetical protein HPP92_017074 [Vanilla planifolia]
MAEKGKEAWKIAPSSENNKVRLALISEMGLGSGEKGAFGEPRRRPCRAALLAHHRRGGHEEPPGCYVAKVTLCISGERPSGAPATATTSGVRFTRVRLLRHKDILVYGQVYRLITSQEVAKALRERRQEKLRKAQSELGKQQKMTIQHHLLHLQQSTGVEDDAADSKQTDQVIRHEREKQRSSRYWRPSLQSISEIGN